MNELKLVKQQILEDYDLWQEAPAQTEVEEYYENRLRESVKKLLALDPDYTKDLRTCMVSELDFKIRNELKES